MYIALVYGVYLVITIAVTAWVAGTLHRNGRSFLVEAFPGNEPLADSVNHLLVVGFYLVNFGYVFAALRTYATVSTARQALELLSEKVGVALMVVGTMHFFNVYVLNRLRRGGREGLMPPPLPPDFRVSIGDR